MEELGCSRMNVCFLQSICDKKLNDKCPCYSCLKIILCDITCEDKKRFNEYAVD
jgi:hypothetical protein